MARRALLIGIDRYAHVRPLDGCANDVALMRRLLVDSFGVPDAHITTLVDEQASQRAILDAFDGLIAATAPDDVVVIHFAGHGSQMTDLEGDEPSGMDSTLVPWDSARAPGENRDITDDVVHAKLAALAAKTRYTTIIVDACHSGTVTRDAFGAKTRSIDADRRPARDLPPSPFAGSRLPRTRSGASGWMPPTDAYVLIAGCRDDEESKEYFPAEGGGPHGALTYFLAQELRRATSGTTYRDLFEPVAAKVTAYNPVQHPQIEGQADRAVFGVATLTPQPFVPVTARDGRQVTLGAGAAQGLTPGSTYAICAAGTKARDGATVLADVTIAQVEAFTATAEVTREATPGVVVAGTRAFETAHAAPPARFAVHVVAPADAAATLTAALAASTRLTAVDVAAAADARAYLLPVRQEVTGDAPVPQAGPLDAPRWGVVGAAGQLLMPLKAVGDEGTVVANLDAIARVRRVLDTDNPDPQSRLRGAVTLDLLRRGPDGGWTPAVPEAASGEVVFEEGENIAFEIANRHETPLHVSLVDIGLTNGVEVWLQERIESLAVTKTPRRLEGHVNFPPGFPFTDATDPLAGAEGIETLKLFVTGSFVDLKGLKQAAVRSTDVLAGAATSPLGALLQDAVGAARTRDFTPAPAPLGQDDWTTVTRRFVIRRRTTALPAAGAPVAIGHAVVTAPTLAGAIGIGVDRQGHDDTAAFATEALRHALDATGVVMKQTVAIDGATATGGASRGLGAAPVLELQLRRPPEGFGQMVLATDELGVVSWCFADTAPASRSLSPVYGSRTYRVRADIPPADPTGARSRGVVGLVGRKILKELVFPLVDPIVGELSAAAAHRLESARWPYRVRWFTPDDYAGDPGAPVDGAGWTRLGQGRALLMVHGTFSRSHLAFGQLPRPFVEALHAHYGERVFAFDHCTLSEDPRQNVAWLLSQVPEGASLDLDIVCHSRGGLVSRLLSERQSAFSLGGRRLRVGKVVLVGVPNAGTALADPEHVATVLDVFTNLMNFLPDNGVTDVMTMILEAAKLVAVGAVGGLPGLKVMRPAGDFAAWLNTGDRVGDTRYFAVASNVTPTEPGLRHLAVSRGLAALLKGGNDMVVPHDGVFAANGSSYFPIADRLELTGEAAVAHTKYFGEARVRDQVLAWLAAS